MTRVHWDQRQSGWISDFRPVAAQLQAYGQRLADLTGRRLLDGWTGVFTANSGRAEHVPLLLAFDSGVQLELNWYPPNDDLSVTWNTVDRSLPIIGHVDTEWRPGEPEALADVIGLHLTGWALVETPYFHAEHDLDFSGDPPLHALSHWQVTGLWLAFGDKGLCVSSNADGAFLTGDQGKDGWYRSTPWPST